jgi:hypothetical protein
VRLPTSTQTFKPGEITMTNRTNRDGAEWAELTYSEMEQVLGGADAADYSAIVFVGGWGSSSYQYAFSGTYYNSAYGR